MTHCGLGIIGRPLYLLRVRDVDTFGADFGAELGLRRVELGLVDVPQCDQSTLGDDAAGDGAADPGAIVGDRNTPQKYVSRANPKRRPMAAGGKRGNILDTGLSLG